VKRRGGAAAKEYVQSYADSRREYGGRKHEVTKERRRTKKINEPQRTRMDTNGVEWLRMPSVEARFSLCEREGNAEQRRGGDAEKTGRGE